jgi:flagellar protein FliO/FliZ
MTRRTALSVVVTGMPALALAADPGPAVSLVPSLVQTTLGLALVVGLIWGIAWLIRRVSPAATRSGSLLRMVATLAVGQRERVVVVEIGDQWLVLGVSAGGVEPLSTLPKGTLPDTPPAASFGRLLARARGTPPAA